MRWNRRERQRRQQAKDPYWFVFFLTICYALFYIIGAGIGYSRSGSYFCLGLSGGLGVVLLLVGAAQGIDFFRGAPMEPIYISVPWFVSFVVAVFMSCIYGMGSTFKSSGSVAIVAWIATVFYFYINVKVYFSPRRDGTSSWPQYSPMHVGSD